MRVETSAVGRTLLNCWWEVLVLYRERSGEESLGDAGILSAGAFSIQRLEGSRYRMVRLWVLNGAEGGEGWGSVESISRARRKMS